MARPAEPPELPAPSGAPSTAARRPLVWSLVKLARPHQWAKSVFVLLGPLYGLADLGMAWDIAIVQALAAAAVFALASSASYVVNDILDAEQDRAHPRKRMRPIASGAVSLAQAAVFAVALILGAAAALLVIDAESRAWVGVTALLYVGNVLAYSLYFKHLVIADVMSLSLGFVLRVLGGCASVGISPTVWLLNCTFFLAMFLAFGKRLGERRSMGELAPSARRVQEFYTDNLLVMAVVVTGVATLVGYTVYVEAQSDVYTLGFNLLWLTVLPATYALFRCIVLLDRGAFDDPTELAIHDRAFQGGALLFAAITALVIWWFRLGGAAG